MKVIFLDRDGVINKYPGDGKYVTSLSGFRFLSNVKKAISKLTKAGCRIFVISNQAGVSKGLYSAKDLSGITEYMLKKLEASGGKINGVYYCMHQERHNCLCRKPKAGLIYKALKESCLKKEVLGDAFFVGDTIRDVMSAQVAGIKSILVFSGKEKAGNGSSWQVKPDYTARDLFSAVEIILSRSKKRKIG
ncbi:MAG: HAD-IIIA family hydrolase [Candidatus Omnitrophota bacterium]|nr:HAD-IIIA family hydrolase [Candidatus Omnitrophota bacterium]